MRWYALAYPGSRRADAVASTSAATDRGGSILRRAAERFARVALKSEESSKMLGGASQIVSMIRVKYNGK